MPASDRYVPKHRAIKESATTHWKRVAAVGTAVPAALGTAFSVAGPAAATSQRQENINDALAVARNQKGDAYEYGADGPERFDCSGLVQFSYGKAGIQMPRTSDAQADRARRIGKPSLRKGDLMFFYDDGGVYHVGVFGGWNGEERRRVLSAPSTGETVHSELVWTNDWFAGTMRGA